MTHPPAPEDDPQRITKAWRILLADTDDRERPAVAGGREQQAPGLNAPVEDPSGALDTKALHDGLMFELGEQDNSRRDDG